MSEICAQFRFAPNGRYLGSATSAAVAQALHAGMPRLPYHKVHQPVLAFFRSDRGIEDWVPYIGGVDSVYRAQSYGAYRVALQTLADARARFRREMPHARVLEIAGASHGIFRSDPEIVYLAMRRFLSARQGR